MGSLTIGFNGKNYVWHCSGLPHLPTLLLHMFEIMLFFLTLQESCRIASHSWDLFVSFHLCLFPCLSHCVCYYLSLLVMWPLRVS